MPRKAKLPANKVDPRSSQIKVNKENAVSILNDYFAGTEAQAEEELFADLKNKNLLNEKLWASLNEVQNIDQAFRGKVFEALMRNEVPLKDLEFYQDSEKEFLSGKIKSLLEAGEKKEIKALLPAYAEYDIGAKDKDLYRRLMEDEELRGELIQSTARLLYRFRDVLSGQTHAELLVYNELVTPDLLVACYAEYLAQREGYLKYGDSHSHGSRMQHIEGSFRILQHGLLNGKDALDERSAFALAAGKFVEGGGKKNYEGLVKSGELPTPSDVIKNYDIDVLNSMFQVRRKGGEEMTSIAKVLAVIRECLEYIFCGGVRKEILNAVKAELGMHASKEAERSGRQ